MDSATTTLDLLCAMYPNVDRASLELCMDTHFDFVQEHGTSDYDVEAALNKLCDHHHNNNGPERPPTVVIDQGSSDPAQPGECDVDPAIDAPTD